MEIGSADFKHVYGMNYTCLSLCSFTVFPQYYKRNFTSKVIRNGGNKSAVFIIYITFDRVHEDNYLDVLQYWYMYFWCRLLFKTKWQHDYITVFIFSNIIGCLWNVCKNSINTCLQKRYYILQMFLCFCDQGEIKTNR